jgi:hypothetical protein
MAALGRTAALGVSGSLNPIESASDAFVCLPSASDIDSLDEAFAATGDVYKDAWHVCDNFCPFDVMTGRGKKRRPITELEYSDLHDQIDPDDLSVELVTSERRRRACGLGPSVDQVFMFYIRKAIEDHRHYVTFGNGNDPYQPWLHIGFPLPFENVSIETTEDGLDWLRFGTIGPVAFGFTGLVPQWVHTACFKRTDDLLGYEVVFVGEEINPVDGQML